MIDGVIDGVIEIEGVSDGVTETTGEVGVLVNVEVGVVVNVGVIVIVGVTLSVIVGVVDSVGVIVGDGIKTGVGRGTQYAGEVQAAIFAYPATGIVKFMMILLASTNTILSGSTKKLFTYT